MAQYDVTNEINDLIASGLTIEEVRAHVPHLIEHSTGWDANGRRSLDAVEALVAHRAAPATAPAPTGEAMATDRQINYAMALAAKNAPGSLTLTVEGCRRMTRSEISRLIDSLQHEW